MGNTYAKILLKFKFNWVSCVSSGKTNQYSPLAEPRQSQSPEQAIDAIMGPFGFYFVVNRDSGRFSGKG